MVAATQPQPVYTQDVQYNTALELASEPALTELERHSIFRFYMRAPKSPVYIDFYRPELIDCDLAYHTSHEAKFRTFENSP